MYRVRKSKAKAAQLISAKNSFKLWKSLNESRKRGLKISGQKFLVVTFILFTHQHVCVCCLASMSIPLDIVVSNAIELRWQDKGF